MNDSSPDVKKYPSCTLKAKRGSRRPYWIHTRSVRFHVKNSGMEKKTFCKTDFVRASWAGFTKYTNLLRISDFVLIELA